MTKRFSSSVNCGPRHVEPEPRRFGRALQLGELRAVVRLAPRLDRVLLDRLRRIGHDQIHVELDDVAEAVADSAGAERIVEREQPRLRHSGTGCAQARHSKRSLNRCTTWTCRLVGPQLDRERRAAAFRVGGLDRIGQPRPQVAVDLHPIDDDLQERPILERRRIDVLERRPSAPST